MKPLIGIVLLASLLAVLLNPIGAKYGSRMRLWEAEAEGEHLDDRGLKSGWSRMRLVREIAVPVVTTEQRITIAIMCGLRLYRDPAWVWWAHGWLDGTDRSAAAAAPLALSLRSVDFLLVPFPSSAPVVDDFAPDLRFAAGVCFALRSVRATLLALAFGVGVMRASTRCGSYHGSPSRVAPATTRD